MRISDGSSDVCSSDLALGDQRPRDRRAEQVFAFVQRIGVEHREHEVTRELFAQIIDEDFLDAEVLRLRPHEVEIFALYDVGGEGHDLGVIRGMKSFEDRKEERSGGKGGVGKGRYRWWAYNENEKSMNVNKKSF